MQDLILIQPTIEYADRIMDFRREFLESDSSMDGTSGLRRCESAQDWLALVESGRKRDTCPPEWVIADTLISVRKSDNKLIGMVNIRCEDNDVILGWAGHIGYCVRPSERRKGYAKAQLALALDVCRERGMKRVMISCDRENPASAKTIMANGGVLEREFWMEERSEVIHVYWLDLFRLV